MTADDEDFGKEGDPEERHIHRIIRNYVNQSDVKEEPDKDSRDDEIQLDRRIQAWNNRDTERMDISTSDDKGAPMELY